MALGVVVAGVVMLPVLRPKGPGHTAPLDVAMIVGILAVFVWAGTTRTRLHMPYAVPMAGLMVTGLVAAMLGASPGAGMQAVIQDLFLLTWCAAVTSVCRTAEALRAVLHAWCITAVAWGVFLAVTVPAGLNKLAGIQGSGDGRARLLFDHPNMTGNYFVISMFVVLAARYPRRGVLRAGAVGVLLIAALLAGSNAALLGSSIGVLFMTYLRVRERADVVRAFALMLGLVFSLALVWTFIGKPLMASIQDSNNSLVKFSVARGSRSANDREGLFTLQYKIFQQGNLLGIGPASTKETLGAETADRVKEAHNDYLATLTERGPLGEIALWGLIGAIAVRAMATGISRLNRSYAEVVPNPAAIVGALVAFAAAAVTHEVLHYRHLWTLLAVLAALYLFGRSESGHATPERPNEILLPLSPDGS